ncbi:MAG: hypothetical protein GY906_08520 [bacterium]|nr:hypothetical protein [bacterium]
MTPDELRTLMNDLVSRVTMAEDGSVSFAAPTSEELTVAGHPTDGIAQLLDAPWLEEMITDVVETPDYADPSESPDQILQYARDVIVEYIRKRFTLEG